MGGGVMLYTKSTLNATVIENLAQYFFLNAFDVMLKLRMRIH